ncbi:MAG TPA: hypothetical protein VE863_16670 [Pyrinomonadaceae bacterium]|jgi:hypothetical protein|nr:hypothetical protein [Pyrinomonadaceae bacterium]
MRFPTHSRIVSALGSISLAGITVIVCSSALFGVNKRSSKIICREDLSVARRQELASKLRLITGWTEIDFDRDGALQLTEETTTQGSPTARELIGKAMTGNNVVVLEDASNRQDVVFSRVVPGKWTNTSRENPPAYVILIDFADFEHLIGDKTALKAFDVGWAFLHELDHVMNDSPDSATLHDPGECEAHINQMRRECDLPLRTEYFFTYFPHAEETEFKTCFVRLAFDHEDANTAKHRRYWVMWDATVVGGLTSSNLIAALRD